MKMNRRELMQNGVKLALGVGLADHSEEDVRLPRRPILWTRPGPVNE